MSLDYLTEHTCFNGIIRLLVIIAICAYCATAGFVINTTAGFDAGLKSNSSGNYEIETYTDNLNITNNTFALGNMYSDRFTFDDADANTWKWNWDDFYSGLSDCPFNASISGGKLTLEIDSVVPDSNGYVYDGVYMNNANLTGNFDIQVNWSDFDGLATAQSYPAICANTNFDDWYTTNPNTHMFCISIAEEGGTRYYVASDYNIDGAFPSMWEYSGETSDTSGSLRLTRTISGDDATFTWYYWNSSWTQLATRTESIATYPPLDDDMVIVLQHSFSSQENEHTEISFDELKVNSGTLITTPYRTSGNWTSATQTMTGDYLKNMTIAHSGLDANTYITQVEWLVGGVSVANYTTDITSGPSTTITAPTAGSFASVNANFVIRLYLVGNGTASPTIESISGEYYTYTSFDGGVVLATDAATGQLFLLDGDATLTSFDGSGLSVLTEYLSADTNWAYSSIAYRAAQSFMIGSSYDLRGATVALSTIYGYAMSGGVTLRIETDNAGSPSGLLAHPSLTKYLDYNATFDGSSTWTAPGSSYAGQTTFIFNESITMNASQSYWLVIVPTAYNAATAYNTGYMATGTYANGVFKTSTNSGTSWTGAAGDMQFMILGGTINTSYFNLTGNTLTIPEGIVLELNGRGHLTMTAGQSLVKGPLTANAEALIYIGYRFGGGVLELYGNSTNPVTILQNDATYYGTYGIYLRGGKIYGEWVDVISKASSGAFYNYGIYSQSNFRNSRFINNYNAAASYSYYEYRTARETVFNNCTFWRNNTGNSYNIYLYATSYHATDYVNCNFTSNVAYAYVAYNGESVSSGPHFIGCTYNGAALTQTHVVNVYPTTQFMLGNVVIPTITANGTPVEGALVTIRPQFSGDDLNRYYLYGNDPRVVGGQAVYIFPNPPIMSYQTNAEGKPVDKFGDAKLWMWDAMFLGTTERRWINYSGSNMSLRPNEDYVWKNDGTDYGYILTVAHSLGGAIVYIPSDAPYTENISIYSEPITPVPTPTYIFLGTSTKQTSSSDSSGMAMLVFAIVGAGAIGLSHMKKDNNKEDNEMEED